MSPEEQRIKIAEACPGKIRFKPEYDPQMLGGYKRWQFWQLGTWHNCHDNDLLNDLNAMHEAEKVLNKDLRFNCAMHLIDIGRRDAGYGWFMRGTLQTADMALFDATSSQRAEAFLKCLGLWKE